MQTYRIYELDHSGHIVGPALAIACATEAEAVAEAKSRRGPLTIEIWRGADLVARLEPAE